MDEKKEVQKIRNFISNLMLNCLTEFGDIYKTKFPERAKDQTKLNDYSQRKFHKLDFFNNKSIKYLDTVADRLELTYNPVKQKLLSFNVYTEEYKKELTHNVSTEELNIIKNNILQLVRFH